VLTSVNPERKRGRFLRKLRKRKEKETDANEQRKKERTFLEKRRLEKTSKSGIERTERVWRMGKIWREIRLRKKVEGEGSKVSQNSRGEFGLGRKKRAWECDQKEKV